MTQPMSPARARRLVDALSPHPKALVIFSTALAYICFAATFFIAGAAWWQWRHSDPDLSMAWPSTEYVFADGRHVRFMHGAAAISYDAGRTWKECK